MYVPPKTLTTLQSAIRHNMAKIYQNARANLHYLGQNDKVTPPDVAEEFNKLFPNSILFIGLTNVAMPP
jgi:hypothetical protein